MTKRTWGWVCGLSWTALASSVVVAVGVGCGTTSQPQLPSVATASPNSAEIARPTPTPLASPCALGVPRARATVMDTASGVDVTVTAPARIDDVRRRVAEAAKLHGPGAHMGPGHLGQHGHGEGDDHGLKLYDLPPLQTPAVDDVENGATIHLAPEDPADLVTLRSRVRDRVRSLDAACADAK